jgi:imidazolonepropionase
MSTLLSGISQLATAPGTGARHGAEMGALDIIEDAAIAIEGDRITWVGPRSAWDGAASEERDLGGRAVVPGLIDPHTHVVWAGARLADFEARVSGVPYEQILARGGGIRSTMRHTAAASVVELIELARPRLAALVAGGATTVELKSGYGFTPEAELASLEAINAFIGHARVQVVPTLLIHVPPSNSAERADYLAMVTQDLIPEVASRGLATAVDIFIEREAFSVDEAKVVFGAALAEGLAVKAHVDQFHAIGGVECAIAHGALSVDHLEASTPTQITALGAAPTIATILPGVTLHLGLPAAPGRALIAAGAAVAVGTDCNPGSSPLFSPQLALALAVRLNGLTPAEALTAGTANAAAALGLGDRGRIAVGQRADLLVLDDRDWRTITYTLGASPVIASWIAGRELTA